MRGCSRRRLAKLLPLLAFSATGAAARETEVPLAIRGYDAVAYFNLGRPARGLATIDLVWDDARYRFATAENRALFQADPTRFAPHFDNFCTLALSRGEILDADPEYLVISGGRLFLFGKPIGPNLFARTRAETVEAAERNRSLLPSR